MDNVPPQSIGDKHDEQNIIENVSKKMELPAITATNLPKPPPLARTATFLTGDPQDGTFSHNISESPSAVQRKLEDEAIQKSTEFPKLIIYGGSRKGAKMFQEDSYFSFTSITGKVIIGGVMDGHGGYNGMLASTTAKNFALNYFDSNKETMENWTPKEWEIRLTTLFVDMHDKIRECFMQDTSSTGERRYVDEHGIVRTCTADPVHGGSTCTITVVVRDASSRSASIITANVGDSTALLLPIKKTGVSDVYEFLSVDHGPENEQEFLRIRDDASFSTKLMLVYDKTNVIRKYECPSVFKENGIKDEVLALNPWGHGLHPTNVRYEPAVYAVTPRSVTKDSTCIAMTRALGDFYAHQFGLSAVPDVNIKHIEFGTNDIIGFTVVIASDGIWDCWRYEDFAAYVNEQATHKRLTIAQTGELVLEESIVRAVANFGAKHYDDAALVIFQLLGPTA